MIATIALGLAVGVVFGYVLQRGRFCMYTAFRDIYLIRDLTLFKAYVLALLVQILLVHLWREFGLITFGNDTFFWLSAMIGGFFFGVGMTLAGGCSSSSFYRVGEGMVGSFVAVLMFIAFATATQSGPLQPLAVALYSYSLEMGEGSATLSGVVGSNDWLFISILVLVAGSWLLWAQASRPARGWGWKTTGLAIGIIAAVAWLASSYTGRDYGLSMTGPSAATLRYLTTADPIHLDWGVFQLLGIPVGAFLAAAWNQEFKWRAPQAKRMMQQVLGGAVMGIAAVIALGCNIGNSLTGIGILSLSSFVATVFLILGTWSGTYVFFVRASKQPSK